MQSTITMGHAPAVRASRALRAINVRKMCARAISLARRQSTTLACVAAAVSYTGVLADCDILAYAAAFATLGFINLGLSDKKGGEA